MAMAKKATAKKATAKKTTAKKTTAKKTTAKKTTAKKTTAKKTTAKKTTAKKTTAKKTVRRSTRPNALTKLQSDHDAVRKLFNRYERNKDAMSDGEKEQMVRTICGELTVHAQIEEEVFYPALRQVADDDLNEMLDEAEVEHTGAKDLIAQLQAAKPRDPLYDAKVTVLGEQVKHHAGEEEGDMFRKAKRVRDLNLDVLGEQLEALSAELKVDQGLA